MGPSVGIDSLSSRLLYRIFEYVHGYETGQVTGGNLCNSLVVCRTWQTQARLVLYRNVYLDFAKLGRFLEAFDHDAVSHITHKMAIRLRFPGEQPDATWAQNIEGRVNQWLRHLAQDVLPHMRQLYRFALIPIGQPVLLAVQKTTAAAVLLALPMSCKDLVLGLYLKGEGHVCGTIRDLLPRMDRVILSLSPVCYSILGDYSDQGFHLNSLPKSLWLLINCKLNGTPVQTCPETHWQGPMPSKDSLLRAVRHTVHGSMEARVTVIPGLGRLDYHVGRGRLS